MRQQQKRAPYTRLRVASRVALRKITTRGDREGVCGSWDTPIHHVGLLSSVHTPPHLLPILCIYLRISSTSRYFSSMLSLSPSPPFLSSPPTVIPPCRVCHSLDRFPCSSSRIVPFSPFSQGSAGRIRGYLTVFP